MDIFKILFGGFVQDLIGMVSSLFSDSLKTALNAETIFSTVDFNKIYLYIATFSFGLLTLNILRKMFAIYVAKIDGDSGTSPLEYLKSYAKAVVIIYSFNFLYGYVIDIVIELYLGISKMFITSSSTDILTSLLTQTNTVTHVLLIIYVVCLLVLQVMLYMNGITILILRLGIPLACSTMIDGSNNKFNVTVQVVGKLILTTLTQLVAYNMSLLALGGSNNIFLNFIASIGCMVVAFSIEKHFAEIFSAGVGSGIVRSSVNMGREIWQTGKILAGGK